MSLDPLCTSLGVFEILFNDEYMYLTDWGYLG